MEFLQQILGEDIGVGLTVVFNLIIIESLLSVDNAAVLATMVMDLPPHQRASTALWHYWCLCVSGYLLGVGSLAPQILVAQTFGWLVFTVFGF